MRSPEWLSLWLKGFITICHITIWGFKNSLVNNKKWMVHSIISNMEKKMLSQDPIRHIRHCSFCFYQRIETKRAAWCIVLGLLVLHYFAFWSISFSNHGNHSHKALFGKVSFPYLLIPSSYKLAFTNIEQMYLNLSGWTTGNMQVIAHQQMGSINSR